MWELMRRDRVLRALPFWAIFSALNVSVITGVLVVRSRQGGSAVSTTVVLLTLWLGVALHLALCRGRERCGELDLALPIDARAIWLAHALASVLASGTILGLTAGVIALHAYLVPPSFVAAGSLRDAVAFTAAGAVLAIAAQHARHPGLRRLPAGFSEGARTVAVVLGAGGIAVAVQPLGLAGAAVVAGLGLVVAGLAFRAVPGALAVEPRTPAPAASAPAREHRAWPRGRTLLLVPRLVLRETSAGLKEIGALPFVALFGLLTGGAAELFGFGPDIRDLRYMYVPMTVYMLFAIAGPRLSRLHRLDALPIPRRTVLAGLVLPTLAVFLAAVAAGASGSTLASRSREFVDLGTRDGAPQVLVPMDAYAIAWDGTPPEVVAAWGERHRPRALRPVAGAAVALYSPFDAPEGSSPEFVAWQVSRAVTAVYGADIPAAEIARRYLEIRPDGTVGVRGHGLTLRADHPRLRARRHRAAVLALLLLVTVPPWLLLHAALLRTYRAGIGIWARHAVVWGSLAILLAVFVSLGLAMVGRVAPPWLARALFELSARAIAGQPFGTAAAWAVAIAATLAAYHVGRRQIEKMEIPLQPSVYTLLDRMGRAG